MMKQNYLKSLFLMLMMCVCMGAWAEEATMAAGTNGSAAKVNDKDAIKVGTSSKGGDMTITVPAGAISLEFYAAAWNGVSGLYLNITPTASVKETTTGTLKADTGISGNSPFTLEGNEEDYKITVELKDITKETTLKFASSATKRFVVWGATYTTGESTPDTPDPINYNVTITDGITGGTISANPTSAAEGATVTLTATPDADHVFGSWNVTGATVADASNATTTFTMPAANVNVSATFTTIPEKTIAEFIASEGGKCYLTGTVSNIANTTYGNFDLTDESGTIYIYGCLNEAGEAKKFAELGVVAGDKIKVLAETYEYFNNTTHEAKNVIFVEELEIEKPQYTVTIETPENGTLVVKEGENVLTSGTKVEEGLTLTIECAPTSEDYRYKNWQYKEDGDWVTMTKTMTRVVTKDITIRANFEAIPTYAIAWSVNGTVVKTDNLKEGATVTAPEVEAINGKVFTGWVATETVAADATPSYVTPTIADKDATYYAVFATLESAGKTEEYTLDNPTISALYVGGTSEGNTTSYSDRVIGEWTGKFNISKNSDYTGIGLTHQSDASKANYGSYLLTPEFESPITSINFKGYDASKSAREIILCDEFKATATKTDAAYGWGEVPSAEAAHEFDVTIDVTGEPHQMYIKAGTGAIIITDITVTTGSTPSYSDFTTTVSAPVTKYNVNISDDIEYGTVTVDKETAAEGETVTLTITPEDGYALAQLMVYTDYDDVDVEGNTFVMPASDVEVYAYFAQASSDTYTLSELAEADIEPYSVVSVSFDNEIVDIQMDEEEGGYIALKDGDNTFVLQTYYACNAEWTTGGTLSGTWENVYYAEQGGAYILMNDSDEPWAGLTYTTPVAPTNGTLTFKATNEDGYWATFSCDKDVIFDANDVVVYTVGVDNNEIVMIDANNNSLSCVTDKTKDEGWVAGYYVQAGAAVLINSVDESVNYYFIDTDPFISNDLNEVETDPEYNMLVPCTETGIFKAEADGNMYYKLAYGDNTNKTKLGFWWGAENGSGNFKVKAGGAVLCVPQATSVKGFSFDMAKDEDAIKGVEQKTFDTVIYDMQGRKVSKTQKGLYIINGRKMVK